MGVAGLGIGGSIAGIYLVATAVPFAGQAVLIAFLAYTALNSVGFFFHGVHRWDQASPMSALYRQPSYVGEEPPLPKRITIEDIVPRAYKLSGLDRGLYDRVKGGDKLLVLENILKAASKEDPKELNRLLGEESFEHLSLLVTAWSRLTEPNTAWVEKTCHMEAIVEALKEPSSQALARQMVGVVVRGDLEEMKTMADQLQEKIGRLQKLVKDLESRFLVSA
jgi:hypothetical protein